MPPGATGRKPGTELRRPRRDCYGPLRNKESRRGRNAPSSGSRLYWTNWTMSEACWRCGGRLPVIRSGCSLPPRGAVTLNRSASRSSTRRRASWPKSVAAPSTRSGVPASPGGRLSWTRTRWPTWPDTATSPRRGTLSTRRCQRQCEKPRKHRPRTKSGTAT